LSLICFRAAWTERHPRCGATSDENNWLIARPRDVQRRGAAQKPLLQSAAGQVARVALPECSGSAAHLLPEAGGVGAGAAAHREHVRSQPALLDLSVLFKNNINIYSPFDKKC
jgi:hypothetical protein